MTASKPPTEGQSAATEPQASSEGDITLLLHRAATGDAAAEEALLSQLYHQLRVIAARQLRGERGDHTLQPTALVNEAYLRLIRGGGHAWNDRVHFFAAASTVMRRILVDHARRRGAVKRGSAPTQADLHEWTVTVNHSPERVLAVDRALEILERESPRAARVVQLKFFGGLTDEEAAQALAISTRTVKRDWRDAKQRLYELLRA